MKIDNELEVSVIDDEDFIDRWKVIPLDFGSKTLFVTENTFAKAAEPLKPKEPAKPQGVPPKATKKVPIYNGTMQPPKAPTSRSRSGIPKSCRWCSPTA